MFFFFLEQTGFIKTVFLSGNYNGYVPFYKYQKAIEIKINENFLVKLFFPVFSPSQ